jgi:hypothetical protein
MPEFTVVKWGGVSFLGSHVNGLGIVGDIRITPLRRAIEVAANALSAVPVEVTDYYSDFGTIAFRARISGKASIGETAPECMRRLWKLLVIEARRPTNTLQVNLQGVAEPLTYSLVKTTDEFERVIGKRTQSRSVIELDVSLRYVASS